MTTESETESTPFPDGTPFPHAVSVPDAVSETDRVSDAEDTSEAGGVSETNHISRTGGASGTDRVSRAGGVSGSGCVSGGEGVSGIDRVRQIGRVSGERGVSGSVDGVRERILDAALAEFSAYGLRRTGMEDLAKRAGVARATVYRRFADKDALVSAVILRESRRFMAAFEEVVSRHRHLADQITEGWVFAISYLGGHSLFSGLLMADAESILPYLTVGNEGLLRASRDFLIPFVRAGQERGEAPEYDPEPVAELMARIVMSYVISPGGCLDLSDEKAVRRFARSHLVPAICCAGGPEGGYRGSDADLSCDPPGG